MKKASRKFLLAGFVSFLVLFTYSTSLADPIKIKPESAVAISEVWVDMVNKQISILIPDLELEEAVQVSLGEFAFLDIVERNADGEILVAFPDSGIPDGDYLLTVTYLKEERRKKKDDDRHYSKDNKKEREKIEVIAYYHLTIGAVGPQGEQGPQGIQGSQGEAGINGQDGAPGSQGVKGDTGSQGPQGDMGPAGPSGADIYQGKSCADKYIMTGFNSSGGLKCKCDGTQDCDGDGYTVASGDCSEDSSRASPGQTGYYSYPIPGTSSYDWNCDGQETENFPRLYQKGGWGGACQTGWVGSIPPCDQMGTWQNVKRCGFLNGDCCLDGDAFSYWPECH